MIFNIGSKYFYALLSRLFLTIILFFSSLSFSLAQQSQILTFEGKAYTLIDGKLYRADKEGQPKKFVVQIYDPKEIANAYEVRDNIRFRVVGDKAWPIITSLKDGFENATSIHDLIGMKRGWTSLTLQSPAAPEVSDYVSLRRKILSRQVDFPDNRVEPSSIMAYSGQQSLRILSVAPSRKMALTKASLDSDLLYFTQGDDFWFSGWFYIKSGTPTSLLDLESSFFLNGPGMRLMVSPDYIPRLELKWADKPTYRMIKGKQARLPLGQWFNIQIYYYLSADNDGIAKLWLNKELIISGKGQTLPTSNSILDRLQLGITANPPKSESIIFIDDVEFSQTSFF